MKSSTRPEVVVVTGSSAGLGRAIVQSFAQRGAHIGFVSRSRERLEYACREVKDQGGTAITLPGDVADSATTEEAASRTEDAFGPIDIWVNDAMTTVFSPFHELSADDFRQVTAVTYLGFVYGTMAALKRMRPRNRGTIVQERHREVFVGWPTARAIWGQRFIPGVLDHLAAKLAWDGQLYDGARDDGPVDLYEPVAGHQGAHGAFDSRATSGSWELNLTMQASRVTSAVSSVAGVVIRALDRDHPSLDGRHASEGQRGQQPYQSVPAHQ
jgi:hypothetical protein